MQVKIGDESIADGSIDEIELVGVLERLPHKEVSNAIVYCRRKLQPGGGITATVPDFEWAAKRYIEGQPIDVQSLVMGGDGGNGAIFDREALKESLVLAGFERIGEARAPEGHFAMRGFKPTSDEPICRNCVAVLSTARYGPMLHARCAFQAFYAARVPYQIWQGAFWHQVMSEGLESVIAEGAEFIYTSDYDSIFSRQDVLELYRLMKAYPEADCIASVQINRGRDAALFSIADKDGKPKSRVHAADFNRNLTRISTAHFGLTIFRASKLAALPRPWMSPMPAGNGRWNEGDQASGIHGKTDADIDFWHNWNKAGLSVHLANKVVIGHAMDVLGWPGRDFKTVYQTVSDYIENGIPAEVLR